MESDAGRSFRYVLLAFAALTVSLILASLGPLRDSFWGLHLYAFVPHFAVGIALGALALGAWTLFRPLPQSRPMVQLPDPLSAPLLLAVASTILLGFAFWLFRSQQTLLGDAYPILLDLPRGVDFHPRQPLAVRLQQQFYQAVGPMIRTPELSERAVTHAAVALSSVGFGLLFVPLVVAITRNLPARESATGAVPWLVAGLLLTQGYMQLFFGYVENYAAQATSIALYASCALLHLRGRLPSSVVAIAFVVALGMHLSSITLLPSLLLLFGLGLLAPGRRLDAVVGLVVLIAAAFGLDLLLRSLAADYSLWSGLAAITHVAQRAYGGGAGIEYTLSPSHLRDFFNGQFLVGPLTSFLFVSAFVFALRRRRELDRREASGGLFLVVLALPSLVGTALMSEPQLGYARDWDLVAAPAVTHAIAGVGLLLLAVRNRVDRCKLLGFAVVLSLVQLVPWVAINHSEARSMERFAALPLTNGRTGVVLGRVHLERGELDQAERWFRDAQAESPSNSLAHAFLGETLVRRGDHASAARAYARAMSIRPDKVEYRRGYATALAESGRLDEAITQLRWLADASPNDVTTWRDLSAALARLGRAQEAAPVNERLLALLEAQLRERPNDIDGRIDAGVAALHLGRHDDALRHFREARRLDPDSEGALYNLGLLLVQLGRESEARSVVERLVATHPRHENSEWIRRLLNDGAAR